MLDGYSTVPHCDGEQWSETLHRNDILAPMKRITPAIVTLATAVVAGVSATSILAMASGENHRPIQFVPETSSRSTHSDDVNTDVERSSEGESQPAVDDASSDISTSTSSNSPAASNSTASNSVPRRTGVSPTPAQTPSSTSTSVVDSDDDSRSGDDPSSESRTDEDDSGHHSEGSDDD